MSTNGKTLKFRAAKLKGVTVFGDNVPMLYGNISLCKNLSRLLSC